MPSTRSHTCWSCIHRGMTENAGRPSRVRCTKTKRMGKLTRGYNCEMFEYEGKTGELGDDGIPLKNKQPRDYRTRKQWEREGRRIKEGETGRIMHASRASFRVYEYYLEEQTEPFDKTPPDNSSLD